MAKGKSEKLYLQSSLSNRKKLRDRHKARCHRRKIEPFSDFVIDHGRNSVRSLNDPITRSPDDPMARWPDDPMARWPDDPMARFPHLAAFPGPPTG